MADAKGHNGVVTFDGSFVSILRKGFLARASIGKGEKRIPIVSVSAVQWKPAGPLVNGYIEFSLGGGNEKQSRFGSATTDAGHNENAVIFTRKQMPEFEALRRDVESAIAARHSEAAAPAASPDLAGQIAQLAALRDQGILTDEEFAAKKSGLLSPM